MLLLLNINLYLFELPETIETYLSLLFSPPAANLLWMLLLILPKSNLLLIFGLSVKSYEV